MTPKKVAWTSEVEGKYYVGIEDSYNLYLHSDGVLRLSTKNKETNEWTGYFNSKEEAQIAMANFWIKEHEEESKPKPLTNDELNLIFKDVGLNRLYYIIRGRLAELGCDDVNIESKRQIFGFLCLYSNRSDIENIGYAEYESMRDLLDELDYEQDLFKYQNEQELIDVLKAM